MSEFYRVTGMARLNLRLFDNTNTTGDSAMSGEMKTYYHDRLIDYAEPKLVHDRFGQKVPIPKGKGKTVEFRKFSPLPKATTALTEGVTPNGRKMEVSTLTSDVHQYGDYIEYSDVLQATTVDPVVEQGVKMQGGQSGRTLDTIVREVLCGGTNKMFVPKDNGNGSFSEVLLRKDVEADKCSLTFDQLKLALGKLKRMNAEPVEGQDYVAIIHTDTETDVMRSKEWEEWHKYTDRESMFPGEIGRIGNLRFVSSTEAKIIGPDAMLGIKDYFRTSLYAAVTASADIYPVDVFTTAQATAINAAIGSGETYKLYVDGAECTVASVTGGATGTCKITLSAAVASAANGAMVCGTGAGKDGSAIYCTLLLGANAYGTTDITGLGLQFIVKQLGSAGTGDPLDQRSTTGWKATKTAERLVEEYMLRIEHSSKSFGKMAVSN